MLKRLKSVSMLLFLMGASTGAAYAVANPGVTDVKITQQSGTCTGIVKDATGETVIGASVVVKGTTNGTITGLDGDFSLSNVKKGDIIVISFVGYQTQEVKWTGQPIDVTLKDDTQQLGEVVVTALGLKREEKALGYAVTEVKGDELKAANTISPVAALQGKVAGVEISGSDGGLFGGTKIQIRGASTLSSNNQPIYVVDGVILDNGVSGNTTADWDAGANNASDYGNELKNLNPDDFETVSVLKGAAATALYGSRGLNGAVVITTKSGKGTQGLGISVSQTFGIDHAFKTPDIQTLYGPGYMPGQSDADQNGSMWDEHQFTVNQNGEHTLVKYRTLAAALLLGSVMFTSCIDEFSELNSDPSTITKPDIRFLFTKCEASFQPGDYAQWFGGFNDLSTWSQTTVSSGGNTTRSNRPTDEANGCGYEVNEVLRYANEIRYQISQLPEEEKATYEYIQYLCNPLLVYLSIQDADLYGSRQYTEAEQARYTNPPLLLPKYDTQEELLEVWLKELDQTINYLSSNEIKDVLNNQDFIYKGDLKKWGKLANSLKLKIAARLINKDRNRAFEIVKQVAESPVGLIATTDDDFVYNKGKFDNNWNNDFSVGVGTQHLIDFLVNNKDPRLLYFFQKNDYNSNVVQAYFDQKREMPDFVEKNVISEVKNGKKVFKEWGGPGEPWVRYYGLPVEIGAGQMDKYEDYFDPTGQLFVLYSAAGAKKSYYPCTYRNQEMVKGLLTYTYPDAPDVTPVQDTQQYGWYGLYFSAAETNFFLAEFTLLGATWNGQKSAQEYFTDGITASVKGYDYVAGQNHIPYYDSPYVNDPHDVSIKLQEEWLTELLKKEAYNLSGDKASDLEKVYIQEYLHYFNAPIDQYVNIMRSGVPMKNSSILPRKEFDEQLGDSYPIPRRFAVMEPLESDQLHDITIAAYKAQGYTYQGTNAKNPQVLHDERVWMDKENPDFGKGPKN